MKDHNLNESGSTHRRRDYVSCCCNFVSLSLMLWTLSVFASTASAASEPVKFKLITPQFIAALGDPAAKSGDGAETWGLWRTDPGPTGVWLRMFPLLKAAGGYAPGNWRFDENDWWLDENGLIMAKPDFPLPPGHYLVTGERETTAMLTVFEDDGSGSRRWELADDATLHDVTHMPCRSARYTPATPDSTCTPASANPGWFKIAPGTIMPAVEGCHKQDYSVLIVIGVPVE